jgi:F-type H+-transporting ATPase subunit a
MHESHELWLTALFNNHLAGPGNSILSAVGLPTHERPWANYITMEILVALFIVILFTIARSSFSMTAPGKLQHVLEATYEFLYEQAHDNIHEGYKKYIPIAGTFFLFVLFSNLLGVIPSFESPTMYPYVPAGIALLAFLYYNIQGLRAHGGSYIHQFLGPVWWLWPLMFPIEVVSHAARPISLTIRLFANMFAGEQVTLVFLGLVPLVVPVAFMGLHVFVSVIQAYVFALLTLIYIGAAVGDEH